MSEQGWPSAQVGQTKSTWQTKPPLQSTSVTQSWPTGGSQKRPETQGGQKSRFGSHSPQKEASPLQLQPDGQSLSAAHSPPFMGSQ